MKLSVNEAKFIGVWAKNCPSIDPVTVLEKKLKSKPAEKTCHSFGNHLDEY